MQQDDEAQTTDDPAPVTQINRDTLVPEEPAQPRAADAPKETPTPAPRSRMREKLLAGAKREPTKKPRAKRIDHDIWNRADRAASFDDDPQPARQFSGRTVALLTVLFIAALIMAQPLQLLLAQQADIAQARQQLSQEEQREQEHKTQ